MMLSVHQEFGELQDKALVHAEKKAQLQEKKSEFDYVVKHGERATWRSRCCQGRVRLGGAELPGASEYDKAKGGGSGDSGAWREDSAEKARRFWLRWREWCYPTQRFAHFATAVSLVVLVQPSSAATERWFSQLKLIVEETGCAILSALLRLRMFMRCNRKVYEILDIVVV